MENAFHCLKSTSACNRAMKTQFDIPVGQQVLKKCLYHWECVVPLKQLLVKQAKTNALKSNTKNLLQIAHTNLKRLGDRAVYAPRLWNETPPPNPRATSTLLKVCKTLRHSRKH